MPAFSVRFLFRPALLALLVLFCGSCSKEARKERELASADEHYKADQLAEAEVEYLNVLKIDPQHGHSIGRLGLLYAAQGRVGRAIAFLMRGSELQPDNLDLRVRMGQLHEASGNSAAARVEAEFVLDRRPGDPDAPLMLVSAIVKPDEIEKVRRRIEALPAPANQAAPALTALAALEYRQRKLKEAEELLGRATAADPNFAPAYATLGMVRAAQRDLAGADAAFRKASETSSSRSPMRLHYAQFKIQTGDVAAGKALLEEITKQVPDYLPPWVALSEIALAAKQYDECAELIDNVLSRDSAHFEALLTRGRLYLARGDADKAVAEFEKLAQSYPRLPVIHYELARSLAATGDTTRALASLNHAVNLAPEYVDAAMMLAGINVRKGDTSAAVIHMRRLLQARPDLVQGHLFLADIYRRQGNFEDALAICRRIEEQQPRNAAAVLLRGIVLLEQQKSAEARAAFEKARELAPDHLGPLEQLVNLDLAEKKFDDALRRTDAEIDRNPAVAGLAQLLRAKTFLAQKDHARAEEALQKAIALNPEEPTAYFLLAGIYNNTQQPEKALARLEQAAELNPRDTAALMTIGVLQEQLKKFEEARDAYEKLLQRNPNSGLALNNLAYLYATHFDELDRAFQLAQNARELQPGEPHVADTLGWILFRKQQYPRALVIIQEAASKLTDLPELTYHLGAAHYMMGEEEEARAALEKALKSGQPFGGDADARELLATLRVDPARADDAVRRRLESIIDERKDDPVALARLAGMHEREGDIDKAIELLDRARQANARNVSALTGLARLHAAKKDGTAAMEFAKAARRLAPDDPQIASTLGRLAYDLGDHGWSASLFQETIRKLPDSSPDVLYDAARAFYSIGKVEDADAALRQAIEGRKAFLRSAEAARFRELIALAASPANAAAQSAQVAQDARSGPNQLPAQVVMGVASEHKGDSRSARETYERVLAQFPEFTPAKIRIAVLGAELPEFDRRAFDLAQEARLDNPGNVELARALGILNYRKGDHARAAALLKEASATDSADAETWYYLGMAQSKLKAAGDSRAALEKALSLNLPPTLAAEARKTLATLK